MVSVKHHAGFGRPIMYGTDSSACLDKIGIHSSKSVKTSIFQLYQSTNLRSQLPEILRFYLVTSPKAGVRSNAMSVCVCMSVCLSDRISQKPHVQTSGNFLYM